MSGRLICTGCGQPIQVPAGHRRKKIQCPCGVFSEVPDSALREPAEAPAAPRTAPARRKAAVDDETERWAADLLAEPSSAPEPVPLPETDDVPALEPQPEAAPPREDTDRVPCRRCGQLVRRQRECPTCDAPEPGEPSLSLDDPAPVPPGDDDDGNPYILHGGNDVLCPSCSKALPPGSTFCTRCGLDFERGKKKQRTFEPLTRNWETTLSSEKRLFLWGICQAANFLMGVLIRSLIGGSMAPFIIANVGFAVMTAFLMGTYDTLAMHRDARGRVTVTKTWRMCFFIASITTTEVRGFSGVATSCFNEVSAWEWLVFWCLLFMGILPGIGWWFCVIYQTTYQAALTRDHGHIGLILFQGWGREQMRDIASTVADASGLPCEGV
jgi:hypothetical protein